jgi:GH25 family lysozyme M1 (1,4-beta-N-acetylmuramidase)
MRGIDVSQHNGVINWNLAKNEIDFAILRLGWIGNSNNHTLDTQFYNNYNACKALGIPVGAYIYNYANNENAARSGAEWALDKLANIDLELPVYFDIEDPTLMNLGKTANTNLCIAFNTVIEDNSDYWAGVYASLDWFNNRLHKDIIKAKYTTWIAHVEYPNDQDKYNGYYDMFQYSWKGRIGGISGNVDMNSLYRNLIAEIANSTPTPQPAPAPDPEPQKSIDEVAQEVIDGLWGNGEERKQRLEAAGYNYNEVQGTVNAMLNDKYYPACNSAYSSLVDALKSVGVDSSYQNRKNIAAKNNIRNYTGTAVQNNQILSKLKAGKLLK